MSITGWAGREAEGMAVAWRFERNTQNILHVVYVDMEEGEKVDSGIIQGHHR
jgi:hypothetical protein